ncbi:Ectonucleoside triphosphate diphosphohydrolase 8, partial [Ophiophagus hannah]
MNPFQYGLVFDAGSSHTSLFVYQWPGEKENNTGMVSQMFSCNVKGPGISSYAKNPSKAGASLRDCLDAAMGVIPQPRQQESPVYLGATAGMRLLRMQNELAATQILEAVSETIQKYPSGGPSVEVAHPCYPKGYKELVQAASLSGNPCTKPLPSTASPSNVTLVGKGNFSLCREKFKAILNFSGCQDSSSCGFEGVYQPRVNGKFLAFSAYYYTFRFLNLTVTSPLATVERAIQVFCARTWEDLSTSYPREKPFHLKNYCGSANYILTLLLDGYGFRNDTWQNIAFKMQVRWSRGH